MSDSNLELDLNLNPLEFFKNEVSNVLNERQINLDKDVEFYLVNLLFEFINPQKFTSSLGEKSVLETPLALMQLAALEAPTNERLKIFRQMGDTSLYMTGFFQDYFNKQVCNIDYFISIGANSYSHVSSLIKRKGNETHFSELYSNLAESFSDCVSIVSEISISLKHQQSDDLLEIYDRWTRTQSKTLKKKLIDSGISVNSKTSEQEQ